MSFKKVIGALAKTGAKTVIAGLSAGGVVGKITGKILARALDIDEDDPELNEKIIAATNTKEGRERIEKANIELEQRKAELFTELEIKKLEAKVIIQESSDDLDKVIFSESQQTARAELAHNDPRVYLTRPWIAKSFFWMVVFIVGSVAVSMMLDWWEVHGLLGDCKTEACFDYVRDRKPYHQTVAAAWNEITILKALGIAVVTWFGSRGVEKAVSNYRGNTIT